MRAAAGEFVSSHENADYYPAFEAVTLSDRAVACGHGQLHVNDEFVGRVAADFLSAYAPDFRQEPTDSNEAAYIIANPDVAEAIRENRLESGFQHWMNTGRSEGRPLR